MNEKVKLASRKFLFWGAGWGVETDPDEINATQLGKGCYRVMAKCQAHMT